MESLLELFIQQNQGIIDLCNLYLCNNSRQGFQIALQNFQSNDQPSTFETWMESLLENIAQQNQRNIGLYNIFMCDNTIQGFQNNQNCDSF